MATPFLDITSLVESGAGEQGFVGLAFDPQYATSGVLRQLVNLAGENVLTSYTVSANADVANAASRVERLVVPRPRHSYRYSGGLAFGPDGFSTSPWATAANPPIPTITDTSSTTCSATYSVSM